jgi:hypothetical protein
MRTLPRHELDKLEHSLAEWRRLVSRQKKRVNELQRDRHNAAGSIVLLRALENSLRALTKERAELRRIIVRRDHDFAISKQD